MSTIKYFVMIEDITHDLVDIAHVRVGREGTEGIVLQLPVPHELNTDWIDRILNQELQTLIEYIKGENK
jgi:hypothetical protein